MLRWLYLVFIKESIKRRFLWSTNLEDVKKVVINDLDAKITSKLFWISFIYLADVVLDWMYIEIELVTKDGIPIIVIIFARIFAGIGTLLYIFDALDIAQWMFQKCCRVPPVYITVLNLFLEDVTQACIAIYVFINFSDESNTAIWGANLATTVFALVTKFVNCIDSRDDYTIPELHTICRESLATTQFLLHERLEINVPKLYELLQSLVVESKSQGNGTKLLDYKVKVDMPGGLLFMIEYINKNVRGHNPVKITFKEDSIIDQQQLVRLAGFIDGKTKRSWTFDFRLCDVGNPKNGDRLWGDDARCLMALFDSVGLLQLYEQQGHKVEVLIWSTTITEVELGFEEYQPFGIQTIDGLCKVLETDNALETLTIQNWINNFSGNSRSTKEARRSLNNVIFMNENNDGYKEKVHRKIEEAIAKNKKNSRGSCLKKIKWSTGEDIIVHYVAGDTFNVSLLHLNAHHAMDLQDDADTDDDDDFFSGMRQAVEAKKEKGEEV
mmetsp:Transcript_215/g.224  ORF Transcript_215/g.224 Transcript_215/m.224 type:complete len:497 (-) Transcript_215:140-1630(-)